MQEKRRFERSFFYTPVHPAQLRKTKQLIDVNGMHDHQIYTIAMRINKRSVDQEYNEKVTFH